MSPVPVIGRFAPSPTGDLHFGSLVSAVGSYLEAKTAGGRWLLRVEDIDPPREVKDSAERIIHDLNRLGMVPDGPVLYQSNRLDAYQLAINQLLDAGQAYRCACTRKDLPASGIYPGTCRNGVATGKVARSVRYRIRGVAAKFFDQLQGHVSSPLANNGGDFIIQRSDGLFAYQLAVVVDDAFQGITQVVRGADLLDATHWQIYLQKALGLESPQYMHLPIALSNDGKKLSKQLRSDPVRHKDPGYSVGQALRFLGQQPPTGLSLDDLWRWAMEHWNSGLIPSQKTISSGKV